MYIDQTIWLTVFALHALYHMASKGSWCRLWIMILLLLFVRCWRLLIPTELLC